MDIEEEEFYMLESPSLDYAVPDASRLRFLEYPQSRFTRLLLAHCAAGFSSLFSSLASAGITRNSLARNTLHCVLVAVDAVTYSPITACSNVRDPVPPAGASSSDVARLKELCELACRRHTRQTGKYSLELCAVAEDAGICVANSAFCITRVKGKPPKKRLKNREFLIAHILVAEGCVSAVPDGCYKLQRLIRIS